jgi:hypothetical protein
MLSFKHFFQQRQLNEGRNITLPPEVLSAIDQNLPQIMAKVCECKKTGQRFQMDLVEFNNKYIKKEYSAIWRLENYFKWDKMLNDPVIQEIKRQIEQQQNNQIIEIVIDPKETKKMSYAAGWAEINEIKGSEKAIEYINKIIDDNRENIIGILDKYTSNDLYAYMRKLQAENNQEKMDDICFRYIKSYFHSIIKKGTVHINEQYMCGESKEHLRTVLVHEIIHCIDPKLIYNDKIKDPKYHRLQPKSNYEDFKKYKSNKVEIEANIGQMVQRIFDLVNNSKDYQKTKYQIENLARQLKTAPKPSSSGFFHWFANLIKFRLSDISGSIMKYFDPNNLETNTDFGVYTRELTPEIRRKVLERLSNAVLQARQMLEAKYKKA